jgi:outer membrane immunogenic protein
MKKHLGWALAAIVSLGATGGAMAADLAARPYTKAPPVVAAPIYNWTGFYLGINGGWGNGHTRQLDTAGLTTGNYNQSGGLVGGTIGYNWQVNSFVLGIEGDWDWAQINGSVNIPGLCVGNGNCFTNLRDIGTVRGRAGFAWNNWLFYGTGGLAFGEVRAGQDSCTGPLQICGTNTRTGWAAGLGAEVGFAQNWSAKLEWLHYDLGDKVTYTPVIPVTVSEHGDIVRAGINYRFNWGSPVVAKY